jgi:hypothetical protein
MKLIPSLLANPLEKDFDGSIWSGFECSGLYPLNKERVLVKLPQDNTEEELQVQQQLLKSWARSATIWPPLSMLRGPKIRSYHLVLPILVAATTTAIRARAGTTASLPSSRSREREAGKERSKKDAEEEMGELVQPQQYPVIL